MKKRYLTLLSILPIAISCQSNSPLVFIPYEFDYPEMNLNIDKEEELYYQKADFTPINAKKGDEVISYKYMKEFLLNNRDNRTHKLMDTKGEMNMLVLPIRFTDSPNDIDIKDKTTYIQNIFFGNSEVTKLESVSSFYHKSSYGNLKIKGEVASWFTLDIPSYNWSSKATNQIEASRKMTLEAIDNYVKNGEDLARFDHNQDGYIDSIYVVYDFPYSKNTSKTSNDELFWAYVDFIKENESSYEIHPNAYGWSSLYFALNGSQKVDASTFIHETGHMLGLQDYYNTGSRNLGYHYQPLGFFDLMDSNQGDHSVFSKYLFNWSSPKVLKENVEGSITLSIFSNTGDYLLIPFKGYKDNPYAEYLLLEYFAPEKLNTPNGLKYQDVDKYGDTVIFEYPSVHGLKIYHVDARLGYFKKSVIGSANEFICLVGEEEGHEDELKEAFVDFHYTNEIKDNEINRRNVLYHLLESSGVNSFANGKLASNATLWGYGDTFGINTYTELAEKAGYSFAVTALTSKDITISFTPYKE